MEEERPNISRVKVLVRIRPLLQREILNGDVECVKAITGEGLVLGNRHYHFDRVFDQSSSQEDIYSSQIRKLVTGCFEGYNATLLAYGQTGSGKTYTMGTAGRYHLGLIPQVIEDIFDQMEENSIKKNVIVRASFIEIYNESIYDLLGNSLDRNRPSLGIRENKDKTISVCGAIEEIVATRQQMINLLMKGNLKRSTSCTNMNDVSSRSHAIFTVWIEQHPKDDESAEEEEITAKFHFVDLAGSERLKKTGATGETMNEGININMGLLHLGDVINALTDPKEKFVPYRNSKLTRILQDSLGGNSNTEMIACISPASSSFEETINTLKYASRAMNIKNKPVINKDPVTSLIQAQKKRIAELEEVLKGHQANAGLCDEEFSRDHGGSKHKRIVLQYQQRIESLESVVKEQSCTINSLEIQSLTSRKERDALRLYLEQNNPQFQSDFEQFNTSVLDQYLQEASLLRKQLFEKQSQYTRLEKELIFYTSCSKRDQEILISKLREIQYIRRELQALKNKPFFDSFTLDGPSPIPRQDESDSSGFSGRREEASFHDEEVEEHRNQLDLFQASASYELGEMQQLIRHRESILKDLTDSQIVLENQLIEALKEQYGLQIQHLEREKNALEKDILNAKSKQNSVNTVHALKVKKDRLDQQMKECIKKEKEQQMLEKLINSQNSKIGELKDDLTKFKLQKVELNRKLKEEHQKFEKLKQSKTKDILLLNRKGMARDKEINKLNRINQRKDMIIMKKSHEAKRLAMANEILTKLNRDKPLTRKARMDKNPPKKTEVSSEVDLEELVEKAFEKMIINIDTKNCLVQFEEELAGIQDDVYKLTDTFSAAKLRYERLQINESSQAEEAAQVLVNMEEELDILHQKEEYVSERYQRQLEHQCKQYDIGRDLLCNPALTSLKEYKFLLKETYKKVERLLEERVASAHQIYDLQLSVATLESRITESNEHLLELNEQHQQSLLGLREELIMRNNENMQRNVNKPDERGKEINNINRKVKHLTVENEQLRKKYEVMTEKYEVARKLGNKDKFIGLNNRSTSVQKIRTFRERRLERQNSLSLDKIDLSNSFRHSQLLRPSLAETYLEAEEEVGEQKWECIIQLPAHESAVQHIAMSDNTIISTACKSVKIWDAITMKCQYELCNFSGFVKTALISPEHNLIATTCEKLINLWDSRVFKSVGVLRGHEDVVKVLELQNNTLFSGGCGALNTSSIMLWDLRANRLIEERERNQDVFSMVSHEGMLYYGTRNHQIKRMRLDNSEISSFDIAHFDSVTCLATSGEYLVSGSKDKSLKLWSLDTLKDNYRYTLCAHNDYINTLAVDKDSSLMFSGSRDGQVKVSSVGKGRIEVLGCIDCHSRSVNGLVSLNNILMTCSSDKTIKIWRQERDTYDGN